MIALLRSFVSDGGNTGHLGRDAFEGIADDVVCVLTPEHFRAVGLWYDDFTQTSDEEVHDLLDRSRAA